jgi:hypothetical protein
MTQFHAATDTIGRKAGNHPLNQNSMRLRIHRSGGKIGTYRQDVASRAKMLLKRIDPRTLFSSGPIVIGVLNPFSVINPDERRQP